MKEFERAAQGHREESLATEVLLFLRQTGKWWLLPIAAVLVLFGLLIALSGTAAAPFIYTLF